MKKLFLLLVAVLSIGLCASAQTRTVKGTVVDATNGEPLIGATVTPAGSNQGVLTDVDGNFSINVANSVKELVFSYVGYDPQTVKVQPEMIVALNPSSTALEEVVVTGYGSGKRLGNMVGSVAVVGQAELANVTTPSFVDALQGKVAGLSILSNSGDPSSMNTSIRMRGVNSLNLDNTPLFILDGAPISMSVFNTINPNDIESITVLKDASSTAIYGSRAANGVIVITSKKGKYAEKATATVRAKYGFSQMTPDKMDMMSSAQYVQYRDLIGVPVNDEQRYAAETLGINTDWRKEIFNGHAPTYSLEGAVTGGSETINYYISLNHMEQEGIITKSGMRRETLRSNITARLNNWFRMGLQTNLGYTKYETNIYSDLIYNGDGVNLNNPMTLARMALPMDSPYYWTKDDNGNVVWGEKAQYLHFTGLCTPDFIESSRNSHRTRATVNSALFEEITPIEGLIIRAQQSVDAYDQRLSNIIYAHEPLYTPMGDTYYVDQADENGVVAGFNQQSFGRYYQFTYTNTAEYRRRFADVHNFTLLIGQESIITNTDSFQACSEGQTDKRQPLLGQGTETNMDYLSQGITNAAMNSYFASLSYNFNDKYFVDLNIRRDGSSKFAPGHRWSTFWSAGAMADLKKEKFLKYVTWLNTAKVRVNYGSAGNSGLGNYAYFGLIGSAGLYNGNSGLGIGQPSNYNLRWESVDAGEVGFTVGFFNKLDVDFALYMKNTYDMIVATPYSMTTGFSANLSNMASMRNEGFDLDVKYTVLRNKDWYWDIHGNLNYNHNKITKLFNNLDEVPMNDSGIIYKKGHPADEFYMVKFAGVDPRDGQQMWYTKEGNITKIYNEERDAVCITGKSPYAPWGGGFGTNLSWRGITMIANFTWALDKYMINNDRYFLENNNFATTYNQMSTMLDVWTKPGDITDIPAPGQVLQFDTHLLEDASFLRLKSLTLQYSFPNKLVQKLGLSNLGVHATGRNLLTFTGYTGYDPEPETNVVAFFYPNTRQYEFGIDVSF